MEYHEKDSLIARIVSGTVRCHTRNGLLILRSPTREQRYIAQEIYREALEDGEIDELFNDASILEMLESRGLWDDDKEKLVKKIEKDLEDFKVKLFQMTFRSKEKEAVRKLIATAKEKLSVLLMERHAYDHATLAGAAQMARTRYLIAACLTYSDGTALMPTEASWHKAEYGPILEEAIECVVANKISEKVFRELSRSEPWRSIWNGRKSEGSVFGVPACDLTEDQRSLQMFSLMFDNIYEHPECPSEDVINDDDTLDGWLILQRRERDKSNRKKGAEGLIGNEKIANSQEVYIMVDTAEDAAAINELNDAGAMAIKKQRQAIIDKQGEVNELELPDVKQDLRMATTQAQMGH